MSHILWTATRLAAQLESANVVYVADDDQHAHSITAALKALCPEHITVHLPSSDALPGDVAPASPANVGARVAALRALADDERAEGVNVACILSGEAAAHRYPPPAAFGHAPPRLVPGKALAVDSFTATLEEIGYFADDRVDEPGEMAIRGEVIDIFPADAGSLRVSKSLMV